MYSPTGREYFLDFNFYDPEDVGSSEYRVIFDLLYDCFDTGDESYITWNTSSPKAKALSILDEVIHWAQTMRAKVEEA